VSIEDFIIALFCRIDDRMREVPAAREAQMSPSELVTIAMLLALKGRGPRAFYRWLSNNYRYLFPRLLSRNRLFTVLATYQEWAGYFLASPTTLGIADSYGVEFRHPIREGRRAQQIGKKGQSNKRWIVSGKVCIIINQEGLVVSWDDAEANAHDSTFQGLIAELEGISIVLTDSGFHAAKGDVPNLKVCRRGSWNNRMLVETVLSLLTRCFAFKHASQRVWDYWQARIAFTLAAFNLLARWHGSVPDAQGKLHLSLAEFVL
jgi:hypothetical protein